MIDKSQLRIGNIISWKDGLGNLIIGSAYSVDNTVAIGAPWTKEDGSIGQGFMKIEGLFPVQISPEWLSKWGFQKDRQTGGYTEYSHPWLTVFFKLIQFEAGGSRYRLSFCAGKECYSPSLEGTFQHVHDLQNLIFAIVRKEISEYKSIEEIVKNWK